MTPAAPVTWLDFLALVLATGAVLDAWRHGSIFATWRAEVEVRAALYEEGWRRYFWAAVLDCPFCMSYHVPWVLSLLFYAPACCWPALAVPLKLPVYCLAATRAHWLIESLIPARRDDEHRDGVDLPVDPDSRGN